ncbi:AlkZ-related protein [Neorhodopirellula lusitana]|uniref:AlkZ-related protein n=1 Tax=Neorhodopirellula lusitana TaxID=445327 RepID=UPI00384F8420
MISTFDEAYQFVLQRKVCTVFGSKYSPYPSLWDNTGLSEAKPESGGWSPKVKAVWDWKTRIPQTYPDTVFYGKVPGGDAVLMEMQHFRQTHYSQAYQPVSELDPLAQEVFELIRLEPNYTGPLRKRAIAGLVCTKSQFDTALKKLQVSLNIVRSNDPKRKNDFWLPMREVHLDIVREHESGDP